MIVGITKNTMDKLIIEATIEDKDISINVTISDLKSKIHSVLPITTDEQAKEWILKVRKERFEKMKITTLRSLFDKYDALRASLDYHGMDDEMKDKIFAAVKEFKIPPKFLKKRYMEVLSDQNYHTFREAIEANFTII